MAEIQSFLLITDLDDTLLGDDQALEHFLAYRESLRDRLQLSLAYASGRHYESVRADIEVRRVLPAPVAVIGAVGTEIRSYPGGEPMTEWTERFPDSWNARTVRQLMSSETDLELQPEDCQSEYKVSFYADSLPEERLDALLAKLRHEGLCCDCIYSSARDLDFLPKGVNKGSAGRFLAETMGMTPERVMVAGNSGNDASLFEHCIQGIIVGNAHDELKRYAESSDHYLSPFAFANGVRDGVQYWVERQVAG